MAIVNNLLELVHGLSNEQLVALMDRCKDPNMTDEQLAAILVEYTH